MIVADDDGVVCVPEAMAAQERSRPRSRAKPTKAPSARSWPPACLGLDMYKMREPLEKAGLRYID